MRREEEGLRRDSESTREGVEEAEEEQDDEEEEQQRALRRIDCKKTHRVELAVAQCENDDAADADDGPNDGGMDLLKDQ